MINWNKPEKSANSLKGWLEVFEYTIQEIQITEKQVDILNEQNTYFNRLFGGGHDVDMQFLKTRLIQYYDMRDISRDKILEYGK